LLQAWFRLLLVDFGVKLLGVPRTARLIPSATNTTGGAAPEDQVRRAQTYARWLRRAARHHVIRAECLHQSLALHGWLRGDGIPSKLEIGVHREGRELRAHAWVRIADQLVGESPATVAPFSLLTTTRDALWS
jgi:hypothetical protein